MKLRAAIDDKCRDCIYDPLSGGGTWREQVAQCSCPDCPLWPVRPMPHSGPWKDAPRTREGIPEGWIENPFGWAEFGTLTAGEVTHQEENDGN